MGFKTASENQTFAFQNGSGHPEAILPVGIVRINLHPVKLIKINFKKGLSLGAIMTFLRAKTAI